jgi:hypothetical protein
MLGNVVKLEHEEDEDVTQLNFKTSGHKLNFRFDSPPSVFTQIEGITTNHCLITQMMYLN